MSSTTFGDFVATLKEKARIEDVMGRYGKVTFKRSGKYLKGIEHDSLIVDPQRGWYEWYSRGERGDVLTWLQHHGGCATFGDAVRTLCELTGIPFKGGDEGEVKRFKAMRQKEDGLQVIAGVMRGLLKGDARAIQYVEKRGFDDEVIDGGGVGYWSHQYRETLTVQLAVHGVALDRPEVVAVLGFTGDIEGWAEKWGIDKGVLDERWLAHGSIPGMPDEMLVYIHWERGRCVYLSGRRLNWTKESTFGKSWNLRSFLVERKPFYNGVYSAHDKQVVVVEGQADAITLGMWGIGAVALAGCRADETLIGTLKKWHGRIVLGLDGDDAGIKGVLKLGDALGGACYVVTWPNEGDANDWLTHGGNEKLCGEWVRQASHYAVWVAKVGWMVWRDRDEYIENVVRVLAGLGQYDRALNLAEVVEQLPNVSVTMLRQLVAAWLKERRGDKGDAVSPAKEKRFVPRMEVVLTDEQEKKLLRGSCDHEGNAGSVYALFGDRLAFVPEWGWLVHTGTHWVSDGARWKAEEWVVQTLKARAILAIKHEKQALESCSKCSRGNTQNTLAQLERYCLAMPSDFDNDFDKLNCANGVVDLRTGEVLPHDPSQKFTYCVPTEYHRDADQCEWIEFLYATLARRDADGGKMETDRALLFWLQQAVGYSLTGHTSEGCLFYLYGPTRSGKGTFVQTIAHLLGAPLSGAIDFHVLVAQRNEDSQNFALAPLKPARYLVGSEPGKYERFNEARMKMLTGQDPVTCAYKGKNQFTYFPSYKIWLTANWPFNADTNDSAAWGRVRIVEFPNSFLGAEDKGLKGRLQSKAGLEGVLSWAVDGAMMWYGTQGGLQTPPSVTESNQQQRHDQDFIQQFLDESCDVGDKNGFTPFIDLYEAYLAWCGGLVTAQKQRSFSLALASKGIATGKKYVVAENVVGGLFSEAVVGTKKIQTRGFMGVVLNGAGSNALNQKRAVKHGGYHSTQRFGDEG